MNDSASSVASLSDRPADPDHIWVRSAGFKASHASLTDGLEADKAPADAQSMGGDVPFVAACDEPLSAIASHIDVPIEPWMKLDDAVALDEADLPDGGAAAFDPDPEQPPSPPASAVALAVLNLALHLLSGVCITVFSKLSSYMEIEDADGRPRAFEHPLAIAWFMSLGNLPMVLLWAVPVGRKLWRGEELVELEDVPSRHTPWRYYVLSGVADCLQVALSMIAVMLSDAGVYAMLRTSAVLFTAAVARVWLKRRFQNAEWASLAGVGVGAVMVGAAGVTGFGDVGSRSVATRAPNPLLGAAITVVSQMFMGLMMGCDQRALDVYRLPPALHTATIGLTGLVFLSVAIPLQHFLLPTPLDDMRHLFAQMGHDWRAACVLVFIGACGGLVELTGQRLTLDFSATVRILMGQLRITIVWVTWLALGPIVGSLFNWLQLIGFVVTIVFVASYKRLIPMPCLPLEAGLDRANLERVLEEVRELLALDDDDAVSNDDADFGVDGGVQTSSVWPFVETAAESTEHQVGVAGSESADFRFTPSSSSHPHRRRSSVTVVPNGFLVETPRVSVDIAAAMGSSRRGSIIVTFRRKSRAGSVLSTDSVAPLVLSPRALHEASELRANW